MEQKDITILVLGAFFILFVLFSLYNSYLNLEDISGRVVNEDVLPSTNLVLRYDFEEGSGDTINDLALNHVGTATAASFVGGKYGGGLSLAGNGYVQVNDANDISGGQNWTIMSWFKRNSGDYLIYKNPDYVLELAGNKVRCSYFGQGATTLAYVVSTQFINSNWNFVACVYDHSRKSLTLYLNGVSDTAYLSAGIYGTNINSDNRLYVGGLTSGSKSLNGLMDTVRIYNSVLSNADLNTIYSFSFSAGCGNGVKEGGEECDGVDFGGETCVTKGFASGNLVCTSSCAIDTSGCSAPAGGEILNFNFDEGSGQTLSDSYGNSAVLGSSSGSDSNDPGWVQGVSGSALNFDGAQNYISVPSFDLSANPPSQLSFAFWLKDDHTDNSQTFIGDSGQSGTSGYITIQRNTGGLVYHYADGTISKTLIFLNFFSTEQTAWKHVVLVADYGADTVTVYKNGELFGTSQSMANALPPDSNNLYIGTYSPTHTSKLRGAIDELRIYNKLLSASEVSSLYSTPPQTPAIPTLDLGNISNRVNLNGNLVGKVKISSSTVFSNNTVVDLNLSRIGKSINGSLSVQGIMDFLNVQGTLSAGERFYPAGDYLIDASKFNVVPNLAGEDYTLTATFITKDGVKDIKTKSIVVEYVEGSVILYNISFLTLVGGDEFSGGDFVNCTAAVYDAKGVGGFSYKIWGEDKSITNPDYSNGVTCTGSGNKQCSVKVLMNIARRGNWTCMFNVTNTSNSFFKLSLNNLTMINSAPVFSGPIHDKTWGGGILGNAIDLKEYFTDPDNDTLIYTYSNASPITVNITLGIVSFNAGGFLGNKSIFFSASDGVVGVQSNDIMLNVTSNLSVINNCIPDWETGSWSDCMPDNKQIRTVVDENSCNNLTGRPIDNQSCAYQPTVNLSTQVQKPLKGNLSTSVEEEGFTMEEKILYTGIILGVFILIIVLIVVVSKLKGRKKLRVGREPEVKQVLKHVAEPSVKLTSVKPERHAVSEEARPLNIDVMHNYVVSMVEKGIEPSKVKDVLEKAGWPKKYISESVEYAIIHKFAKDKINKGVNKEEIKNMLISKKWNKDLVNEVLSEL